MQNCKNSLIRSVYCDICKTNINFKIEKEQLDELKNEQLFNFVVIHAQDHTIVVSIDSSGNVRRTRTALLNKSETKSNVISKQLPEIPEYCDNIADAFSVFLKKTTIK
ncbi:MAG: hypothetical protein ACTSYD_03220 [Candidatus Heimdallarchaeaceae archaeon]